MPSAAPDPCPRYRPRAPTNDLKLIVEDYLETLLSDYDERFRDQYGPLHPRFKDLFERFTRCGDLHFVLQPAPQNTITLDDDKEGEETEFVRARRRNWATEPQLAFTLPCS